MPIATLSIDIEARFARLEAGVARANTLLGKLAAGASQASQRVGEVFSGVLGANLAADAINRIVGLFPAVVDGVLAIKDLAEATGSTVENISALDDIARRAGGDLKQVEGVIIKFNAALKEADGKNGISQALQALGLNAAELRRLDPAEALLRAAQAIDRFADDGNRARIVQELFGKGVKDASTFLRDLAEAGQLNAKITAAQAEQVDRFDKSIAALKANIVDLVRAALGPLLARLEEVFTRIDALRKTYGSVGSGMLAGLSAKAFIDAADGVDYYTREVSRLQQVVAKLRTGGSVFDRVNLAPREEDLAAARKALEFYQRVAVAQGNFAGGGRGFVNPPNAATPPSLPALSDPAKTTRAAAAWDDYQQTLTRGLAELAAKSDTVKLSELNAQLQRLEELAAAGLDPKIVEQVRAMLFKPEAGFVGPQLSPELERVNELLKQTDSARLAAAARDLALLRQQMATETPGTQRWAEYTDALLDAEAAVERLRVAVPEMVSQTDEAAQQMRQTIEGALGSTLSSALRGEFSSIGQMWRNLLVDMAARAISADILNALLGGQGGKGGGGGSSAVISGLLKLLFGSASGNAFGPGGLIPFAAGGVVNSATPFTFGGGRLGVMGEAGPEAILPLKRGRTGQLGVVATGGAPVVHITNQVTVHGGASRADVLQAMAIAQQRAVASIHDAMRRGQIMPAAT